MKSLLEPVLTSEQCAACRFCCTFARFESWETPLFSAESIQQLTQKYGPFTVKHTGTVYTLDLEPFYKIHGDKEYAPCPFLDKLQGCILSDAEKPIDCKIWPLRIMKQKTGNIVIALTPTCRGMTNVSIERMKKLITDNAIDQQIYAAAQKMPDIVKEYRDDFPVLMECCTMKQQR
jgi:hypothetical protein